jgi:hypothetical protein
MKPKSLALSLGVAVLLCMSTAFAQTYTFQTINYSGDTFTQLLGINNENEIAGYHGFAVNQGFTYSIAGKKFTSENYPGSAMTQVIGINNNPKTVGFYVSTGGTTSGFTYYHGTFTSVAYPGEPFNQLLGQNDYGQAVGYYSTSPTGAGPDTAYIFDEFGIVFEAFEIPGSTSAQATGINNAGSVCGFYVDGAGVSHGWVEVQGHFTVINAPKSTATAALGLNNAGQVVGTWTDTSGNSHGFVYTISPKHFVSVDDPEGIGETIVNGINDKGSLVGFYGPSACTTNNCQGFVATVAP